MAIVFNQNVRTYSWTDFKAVRIAKKLNAQYDDDGFQYTIYSYDNAQEVHTTVIFKGTVPPGVISGGYSQSQNDTDKAEFEASYKSIFNRPLDISNRVTAINAYAAGLSALTYFTAVDLSNEDGYYKHIGSSSVKIMAFQLTASKDTITDTWAIDAGAVLAVDGYSTTIGFLETGAALLIDTTTLIQNVDFFPAPNYLDLTVFGGQYINLIDGNTVITTDINNTLQLPDANGNLVNIDIGDLILRVTRLSGSGTLTFQGTLWYYVE